MNTVIVSIDHDALPLALLSDAKDSMNVDFDDKDALITRLLRKSIEQFERNSGITVFETELIIEPEADDFYNGAVHLDVTPIRSIGITASSDQVPHSDEAFLSDATGYVVMTGGVTVGAYTLKAKGIHGVRIYHLHGSYAAGDMITVMSGYTPENITPEIRETVIQIAAHYYEFREIYIPGAFHEPSMWLNQVMSGFWLPRV